MSRGARGDPTVPVGCAPSPLQKRAWRFMTDSKTAGWGCGTSADFITCDSEMTKGATKLARISMTCGHPFGVFGLGCPRLLAQYPEGSPKSSVQARKTAAGMEISLFAVPSKVRRTMNWPTAAVLIAIIFALMVVSSTFIAGRFSKK